MRQLTFHARHLKRNEKYQVECTYIGPRRTKRYRLQVSDEGIVLKLVRERPEDEEKEAA
jgi:hypothetical protein